MEGLVGLSQRKGRAYVDWGRCPWKRLWRDSHSLWQPVEQWTWTLYHHLHLHTHIHHTVGTGEWGNIVYFTWNFQFHLAYWICTAENRHLCYLHNRGKTCNKLFLFLRFHDEILGTQVELQQVRCTNLFPCYNLSRRGDRPLQLSWSVIYKKRQAHSIRNTLTPTTATQVLFCWNLAIMLLLTKLAKVQHKLHYILV